MRVMKNEASLSDLHRDRHIKDMNFFFGVGNYAYKSNKYFTYKHFLDDDNVIVNTANIKDIKGNPVFIVKLNRRYYRPYTFRFTFDDFSFDDGEAYGFDHWVGVAKEQDKADMPVALGNMHI